MEYQLSVTSTNKDQQVLMTSLEIADLTGKQHAHILRDVRNMLSELSLTESNFGASYVDATGRTLPMFKLPKRETLILVSGYDTVLRARVIDRLAELEQGVGRLTASAAAKECLGNTLDAAALLGVPAHYAQVFAVKLTYESTGVDYRPLLAYAPAQDNISNEDLMLEPTELGKKFGVSAIAANRILQGAGLQNKVNDDWVPAPLANGKCAVHHWVRLGKSGYNLKWNLAFVEHLFSRSTGKLAA